MKLIINTDGAARGNPGPAGIGVVIAGEDGSVIAEACRYLGETTNNVAEYRGLIEGLTLARRHLPCSIEVRMDSELVVRQMCGHYRVKQEHLAELFRQAQVLAREFSAVTYVHVPRARNAAADKLANIAIDTRRA